MGAAGAHRGGRTNEGSVRDHERSVSERHHPDDFTELVVRTAAANGQIQDRLWIDTPETRIAP